MMKFDWERIKRFEARANKRAALRAAHEEKAAENIFNSIISRLQKGEFSREQNGEIALIDLHVRFNHKMNKVSGSDTEKLSDDQKSQLWSIVYDGIKEKIRADYHQAVFKGREQ